MTADRQRERRPPREIVLDVYQDAVETATDEVRTAALVPSRLADAASVGVGKTPNSVVYEENKLELLHYESLTDEQHQVPILIVYALINRPYILDLQPDRSIVRRLLEAGHDVYLIDWHEPSRLDSHLGLSDYVNRYLDNCVDTVRERSARDEINLFGYCMGGTISVIYAASHSEKVNTLALMATGLCFDDTGGVLELWGDEDYYDPRAVTNAFGNVPGEFLATGFDLMDPVSNYVTKYLRFSERLENEDFVRNFARMEQWLSDSVDLAGTVYVEFLEDIYQENRLYENELVIDDTHIDVTNIDMPMLQIVGEHDRLVPPAASIPFNDVVGTDDVTTIEYPSGHVGLAMSTGAHRDLWPEVAEWFLEHSDGPTLADVLGEGIENALGVDVETDVTVGNVDEIEIGLGDEEGEIARAVINRDAETIRTFLEDVLGVEIGLVVGPMGIAVEVATDDGVKTTVVKNIGEAIRTEVEEAVEMVDVAASYTLEDIDGIGPTYAERLRSGGIRTASELAVADETFVAQAAEASEKLATNWIVRARRLIGAGEPVTLDR